MKVRVSFTLDIDAAAWSEEYGVAPADVRADVQKHVEQSVRDQLDVLEVGR